MSKYFSSNSDINSYEFSHNSSDDDDSSNSFHSFKRWPDTYRDSIKFVRDAEIEIQHYRLERHEKEMEGELADREVELQNEIRQVTSEVTDLRLQINQLELELSKLQDQKSTQLISIRASLESSLDRMKPEFNDLARTIEQLQNAIEAQRENYERNKNMILSSQSIAGNALDDEIEMLKNEIDKSRKFSADNYQRINMDMNDANTTIEMIQAEIDSIQIEDEKLLGQIIDFQKNLVILKRELIIEEETSASLQRQVRESSELRAKMRGAIDRAKDLIWKTKNANFNKF